LTEGAWLAESDRIAAALRAAYDLDFDFTILRYVGLETNHAERWDRILFVLEPQTPQTPPLTAPQLDAAPLGGEWVDRARLQGLPLTRPEQTAPLLRYLDENAHGAAAPRIDPRRPAWARPGWYAGAAAWVEDALRELGYTQTGPVTQLRNWSISSLARGRVSRTPARTLGASQAAVRAPSRGQLSDDRRCA
jgi:hypothetical protein